LWLETAVHVKRYWAAFVWTHNALALHHIVTVDDALAAASAAKAQRFATDPLGQTLVRNMMQAAARSDAP
jgi:hypothetical protein